METRAEQDALGVIDVPRDALWGAQTQRALTNFALPGLTLRDLPGLVTAYAEVKAAAARANAELGALPAEVAAAIEASALEVAAERHGDGFPLPVLQGGGGTSTNMNLNEVIANLAEERLGGTRGAYALVRPLRDVNRSQSTNDTYPTALALATIRAGVRCVAGIGRLEEALRASAATAEGERLGRTCLQDAVPVPVGAGLQATANALARTAADLDVALGRLQAVPLGGTAVGTGLGAQEGFAAVAVRHLGETTGLQISESDDRFDALRHADGYVAVASELGRVFLVISKLAADLRLLSSGPRGGLGEVQLPAMQPGSSIMPGKVNPVVPELVLQVGYELAGVRTVVEAAAGAGELELNVMEPAIAASLLPALAKAGAASELFAERCIEGLSWDRARIDENLAGSLADAVLGGEH